MILPIAPRSLAGVLATLLVTGYCVAAAPPTAYQLKLLPFAVGSTSGQLTGFNDLGQITYFRVQSGNDGYWWNGSQSLQLDPGAAREAVPEDINNSSRVVGARLGESLGTQYEAAYWDDGVLHSLGRFGGTESVATVVNNAGVIGGWYLSPSLGGGRRLFQWNSGDLTDLGSMPNGSGYPTAMNDSGEVVGHALGLIEGWVFADGQYRSLPDLNGGPYGSPRDINNSGRVVGLSYIQQVQRHAVEWIGGTAVALAEPSGAIASQADAINDAGVIVGSIRRGPSSSRDEAVAWFDGQPVVLRDLVTGYPEWSFTRAHSINALGEVLVTARSSNPNVNELQFILQPVPEPMPAILIATGLTFTGLRRRR